MIIFWSESMKILYITSSFPFGPGESFLIPEINELIHQGHEILIFPIYPRGRLVHEDAQDLLCITYVKPLLSLKIFGICINEVIHKPKIIQTLYKMIIQKSSWKTRLKNFLVFPKSILLSKLTSNWHAEHLHAHWAATTSTAALIAGEVNHLPWSFTAHRWDIIENNLLKRKVENAAFVRFISQNGLDTANKIISLPKNKSFVIHMGVKIINNPSKISKPLNKCVILCPANLIPVKGHRYLLEAMSILKNQNINAILWLAGQGELLFELQQYADTLGIKDRVLFLGEISHYKILELYYKQEVDITVLPSIDLGNGLHEGIPVSLMEAMSYCIPTVSTFTGGIPELLHDGAGLLVPPMDPEALAEALKKLILSRKFRYKLGLKGMERLKYGFSISQNTQNLINLITHYSSMEYAYLSKLLK